MLLFQKIWRCLRWYWSHIFCRNIDQVRRNSKIILCRNGCMGVFPVVVLNKTCLAFLPTLHNYSSVHSLVLLRIIQVQNEMVSSLLSWRRKSVPMRRSCLGDAPSAPFLSIRFHLQFWRLHAMLPLLSNAWRSNLRRRRFWMPFLIAQSIWKSRPAVFQWLRIESKESCLGGRRYWGFFQCRQFSLILGESSWVDSESFWLRRSRSSHLP